MRWTIQHFLPFYGALSLCLWINDNRKMERWNRSTNANDNTLSFASAFLFSHLFPRSRNPVTTEREKYPEQKNHKERCQFNSIPSKVNQIPKPYIISIMYNICDRSESNKNFQLYILVLFLYLSSISLPAFSSRFFFFRRSSLLVAISMYLFTLQLQCWSALHVPHGHIYVLPSRAVWIELLSKIVVTLLMWASTHWKSICNCSSLTS